MLNKLGGLCYELGTKPELEEAKQHVRAALSIIAEDALNDTDVSTAESVHILGKICVAEMKISDASKAAVLRGETASAENTGDLQKAVVEALDRLMGGARSESSRRSSFKMEVAPEGTSAAVLDYRYPQ